MSSDGVGQLLAQFRQSLLTQDSDLLTFKDTELGSLSPKIPPQSKLKLSNVLEVVRDKAQHYPSEIVLRDVGTVQHIGNGVATLSGLWQVSTDEIVNFPQKIQGLVLNLDHDTVDVILLGPDEGIRGGDVVLASGERLQVPVGPMLAGRVLDALGKPIDGRGLIIGADRMPVDRPAPGVVERSPVNQPLYTGAKIIDALFPIGRGQRELIIGDRQTGKTTLAVDTILSQAETDVYCVYVAVGQKKSSTLRVIDTLRRAGALEYTTVIVSSPDDPPAMRYLAPYTGCTMAEYMVHEINRDALVVFDDLSKHANAYRELSLLLRRPPGREAYPGDIFYLHARLLERACKLNDQLGGASLSALPIAEIQRGNLSAYIPTNLISITDGQIVLDTQLFNKGILPAIDAGRSVSRVGSAAQVQAMRDVAGDIRLVLAQYEEVAHFARFGAQVDEATQRQIQHGQRLQAVLAQPAHQPKSLGEQVVLLFAASHGYLDHIAPGQIAAFDDRLIQYLQEQYPEIIPQITRRGHFTDPMTQTLNKALDAFIDTQNDGEKIHENDHDNYS